MRLSHLQSFVRSGFAKFSIFFAVLLLSLQTSNQELYAQCASMRLNEKINSSITGFTPHDKSDRIPGNTVFNLKLLGVVTANEMSTAYYTYGYGVSPSAQFTMGSVLTFFTEVTVCRMKFIEKETTNSSSATLYESMKFAFLVSMGLKVYPFKKDPPIYGKIGFGSMSRTSTKLYNETISTPPVVKLGFGYVIPVSKLFNISPEFETNIIGKTVEFTLGAGIIFQP